MERLQHARSILHLFQLVSVRIKMLLEYYPTEIFSTNILLSSITSISTDPLPLQHSPHYTSNTFHPVFIAHDHTPSISHHQCLVQSKFKLHPVYRLLTVSLIILSFIQLGIPISATFYLMKPVPFFKMQQFSYKTAMSTTVFMQNLQMPS